MTAVVTDLQVPPITRAESFALAEVAIARELAVLRSLEPEEWEVQTACPAWDVRQVVIHQVVSAQAFLSPIEGIRQMRAGKALEKREGLAPLDAFMQAAQRAHDDWSWQQALERFAEVLPRFARHRRRFPQPLRSLVKVPTNDAKVGLGYLFDRVINRDHLMHRVDICDATNRPLQVTADHEGRLVADVVAEWASLHASAFELALTGPAGGRWSSGTGGEQIECDAIEFLRVLSGRGRASGLLTTQVLF